MSSFVITDGRGRPRGLGVIVVVVLVVVVVVVVVAFVYGSDGGRSQWQMVMLVDGARGGW